VLQNGTILYIDTGLTTTVPTGYYSNGTKVWYVDSGVAPGVLTFEDFCGIPITTTTSTTSTTSTTTTTTIIENFLAAETNDEITTEGSDPILIEQ